MKNSSCVKDELIDRLLQYTSSKEYKTKVHHRIKANNDYYRALENAQRLSKEISFNN